MLYAGMIRGNAARAPKTAAAIGAIAAMLLAGVLAPYVSPDVPDDWPLAALPTFLGEALAHIQDSITVTAIGSIDDRGTRELAGAQATDIIDLRGQLFAFVAANDDDGIQMLDINTPGNITAVAHMSDNSTVALEGANDIELFIHGGAKLYAAVASNVDDGVQILDVTGHFIRTTPIVAVSNVTDGGTRELEGATAIDVFDYNDKRYAAVASFVDDGIQILNLTVPTTHPIPTVGEFNDTSDTMLDGVNDIKVVDIGGKPYAVTTAAKDDALQVLNLTDPANIVAVNNTADTPDLLLHVPDGLDVFKHLNGHTYAVVAAYGDNGIQMLDLTSLPDIIPAGSISQSDDNGSTTGRLASPTSVTAFTFSGDTYAAVGTESDGVKIVNITDPDNPVNAGGLDSASPNLFGVVEDIDALPGGDKLVLTSWNEDKIQIVSLNTANVTNTPPVVDVGANQTVTMGDTVTVTATASDDDSDQITYEWKYDDTVFDLRNDPPRAHYIENLPINFANPTSRSTTFTAPTTIPFNAIIPVRVLATDAHGATDIDALFLTVLRNAQPDIDAGPDQVVIEGSTVTLAGTATDSDPLTHTWTPNWRPSNLTLSDPSILNPTFIAPEVPPGNANRNVTFTLKVSDGNGLVFDDVLITSIHNQPPTVDAGPPHVTVNERMRVQLNGTASDPENYPLTYAWVSDNQNLTLSDPYSLRPTFIAPEVPANTTSSFVLDLTAYDPQGESATDQINITVADVPNQPPQFNIGPNREVNEGDTVTLTAGNVTDYENHTPFTYYWRIAVDSPADGPAFNEPDHTTHTITVTAPLVKVDTAYHVFLHVTDSEGAINSQLITLTVRDVPSQPPIVGAGPDRAVDEGDQVTLTGSATDPEGEAMTYLWLCRADGVDITYSTTASTFTFTAPQVNYRDITYTCTFTATDPHGARGSDTMNLIVRDVPDDGPVLNLIGDYTPTVTVGNTWTDPGASCVTLHDGNALRVRTSGSVDTGTVGSYDIKYSCSHNGIHASQTRTVTVQQAADDQPPDISLVYIRTVVAAGVTDPDYSSDAICQDNEDGDISHTITTTVSFGANDTATITYSCTDSANHTVEKTQKAKAPSANTPPEMDVIGGFIHLKVGDTFEDPGAVCHDAEDGTFDAVMISNTVDTTAAGTYAVVYQCTDSGGMHNNGGGARTVWVIEGDLPPVLTISDTSDITIPVNGTWSVPSATCTDKEDGDLTDEIEVRHVHSVDVTKPGTYYITYYCVDSTNQHVQTSIKVIVEEGS